MEHRDQMPDEPLPTLEAAGDHGAPRKTWKTPELVKMDVVDSTRAGGVVRALPESAFYRPS